MPETKNDGGLSGVSVALGFVALGLVFGYWFVDAYGHLTRYVAALFILIGMGGFLIEIQKKINLKNLRLDNGGVGLIFLVPGLYLSYLAYKYWKGWERGLSITVLGMLTLVGFMALIDLFISIFEEMVKADDAKSQIIGFLKFLAVCATSVAATWAAVQQVLR